MQGQSDLQNAALQNSIELSATELESELERRGKGRGGRQEVFRPRYLPASQNTIPMNKPPAAPALVPRVDTPPLVPLGTTCIPCIA